MKWLFRVLFRAIGFRLATNELRRRSLLFYLRALRGLRLSLLGVILLSLLIQAMALGLAGSLYFAISLWPGWDATFRLQVLLGASLALFFFPLFIFLILLSERLWFRMSGAQRLMKN